MRFCTFSTFAQRIFKGWGCNFTWSSCKVMRSKSMKMVFVARIIRNELCMIYALFDCKTTLRWPWYQVLHFTWSFGRLMHIKSLKLVFVARIFRHRLCMIYAYFDFFCSKIIFNQKLFSYCWDKIESPGSIVHLSC